MRQQVIEALPQPPPGLDRIIVGSVAVVLGLALFMRGLEMGPFPLGEAMAVAFARCRRVRRRCG